MAKSVQPKQLKQSWNKHLTVKRQTKKPQKFGELFLWIHLGKTTEFREKNILKLISYRVQNLIPCSWFNTDSVIVIIS